MSGRLESAYGFLKYASPLRTDCGKLCSKNCCHQNDKGMLLFPGEEKFFENDKDFNVKIDSEGRNLLFCNGKCDRKKRPVSCRIYPLFPYTYEENGRIIQKVIYDIRGINSCEIIDKHLKVRRSFVSSVRKAGKVLLLDEKCKEFLLEVSREIDDIIKLNEEFGG